MTKKEQTSECRERNNEEESKKDSKSAGTGNTDSPERLTSIQAEVRTVQQQVERMQARTVQTRKPQRQQLHTPQGRGNRWHG